MKLCRLRLKNINSLAGEWIIDFEDPAYNSGIFAITGPTGSGKTTILDALCLALFNETPRISSINDKKDEVMTRGCKDCLAEAIFETGGKRYCALWSHRFTRGKGKKTSTNLDSVNHKLSLLGPSREGIIAEKITTTRKEVEKLTKLDFERFKKTVILPQGSFAEFLKAPATERANLLSQLTGGEIYKKISMQVYDRAKKEKNDLDIIEAEKKQISSMTLSDDKRKEISEHVKSAEEKKSILNKELEDMKDALAWYEKSDRLCQEEQNIKTESAALQAEKDDFKPWKEKLDLNEQASKDKDLHTALVRYRKEYETLLEKEEKAEKESSKAQEMYEKRAKDLKIAQEKMEVETEKQEKLNEIIETVEPIDAEIKNKKSSAAKLREEIASLGDSLQRHSQNEQDVSQKLQGQKIKYDNLLTRREDAQKLYKEAVNKLCMSDLSALALDLKEGTPCPLCGALHHPAPYNGAHREEIKSLRENIAKYEDELSKIEKNINKCNEEIGTLSGKKTTEKELKDQDEKTLETKRQELENLKPALAELLDKRDKLFGDHDCKTEREAQKKKTADSQKSFNEAFSAERNSLTKKDISQENLKNIKSSIEDKKQNLSNMESEFSSRLKEHGFTEENKWLEALLDDELIQKLNKQKGSLENRESELTEKQGILKANRDQLGKAPSIPQKGLKERISNATNELENTQKNIGQYEEQLKNDKNNRDKLEELEVKYAVQEKKHKIWKNLDDRIGSSQGDKFNKIVQNITFRRLVRAANKELETLTGRYRLKASSSENLSFEAIDLWRGGETRSIANLSGGETFLVSLALALALSHRMKELKVDSLFLDEGFGTLDEATLEIVLDSLSKLQQQGKIIGIISHVKALQERIQTQICLIPDGGGHSKLVGPGCKKV